MPSPLAARILKQLTLPRARRTFDDRADMLNTLSGAHFFECSEIIGLANDLFHKFINENSQIPITAVLPAERTWIEWLVGDGRCGFLLEASDLRVGKWSYAARLYADFASGPGSTFDFSDPMNMRCGPCGYDVKDEDYLVFVASLKHFVPAIFCIINTPKICKRVLRTSNKNLQRRLPPGKWPLLGWQEIKINIDRKLLAETGVDQALTGRKALHFVRTFFRIQNARLVMVRPHWRGDASLGIVNSRYRVTHNPECPPRVTP